MNKILLQKFLIIFLLTNIFSSTMFSQEENISEEFSFEQNFAPLKLIAETNYPVNAICFSNEQQLFGYAISDTIILCDNFTDETKKVILGHTGKVKQISFFSYDEIYIEEDEEKINHVNALLSYDDNNRAFIFDVNTKEQKAQLEYNPIIKMTSIANYKNNYVVAGLDDGNIIITNLNDENKNQQLIKITESSIINIEYNKSGNSILLTDSLGNVFLISSENFSKLLQVYGYSESCAGAKFNNTSESFLYQTAINKLTLRNTEGIPLFDIEVPSPITNFIWNKDCSKIYVATQNGLIWIYSDKGILEGAVFAENPDKIISMDTDVSNKFLLVGFEKGVIIKLFLKTKMILPDEALQMQKELDEAEQLKEQENQQSQEDTTKKKIKKDFNLPVEDWAIEVNLGFNTLPEPYTVSVFGGARYLEFELLSPVALGLGLNYNFGFPQKDFPYKYFLNSREFHAPFLSEFVPYFSVGYNLAPIKNFDFLCTAELRLGVGFLQLWSANLAANLSSKFIPTLYSAIGISASIYNWGIFLGGEYNTCLGFGFTTSTSYRFDFKRKEK